VWLRLSSTIFAVVLSLFAIWIAVAELVRPQLAFFPTASGASEIMTRRASAARAAAIGSVRGDLWVDAASGLFAEVSAGPNTEDLQMVEGAHAAARGAAMLSPHDSRAWLLLAASRARLEALRGHIAGPLKMSYLTGPNAAELMAIRLPLAVGSEAIADEELQLLVQGEITAIVTRRPGLKPVIAAAYRRAVPEGKRVIEQALGMLDPSLADALRSSDEPKGRTPLDPAR
jgi:hypothetical protein